MVVTHRMNELEQNNFLGLGRVRFCVPGDIGRFEFNANFVRSRCSIPADQNSIPAEERRAPIAAELPNKQISPCPANSISPDAVAITMNSSLHAGASLQGISRKPVTGNSEMGGQHRGAVRMLSPVPTFSLDAPLVESGYCRSACQSEFSEAALHLGLSRIVRRPSVSCGPSFVEIPRSFPLIGPAFCAADLQAGVTRLTGSPRTCPQIRVSDEEGNADQRPPARGKSDRHCGGRDSRRALRRT